MIPYFETGHLILQTLRHLYNAVAYVQEQNIHWKYEIIIVDDGSIKFPVKKLISKSQFPNLKILLIKKNRGRSVSRNLGLKCSQYELCLFIDSDILIDHYLLTNHLKIQSYIKLKHKKHAVTVTFFEDISQEDERIYLSILKPNDLILNDFRLKCIYRATWYGCEEDKKFTGRKFEIARDTNYFRDWQERYGPWILPNMVLGGFFIVGTESAKKVYGFDESFERAMGLQKRHFPRN